jgi:hypothetical protein
VELDRVIDREPDQDRQAGDHSHRKRAAEEGQQPERHRTRGQADAQGQQA